MAYIYFYVFPHKHSFTCLYVPVKLLVIGFSTCTYMLVHYIWSDLLRTLDVCV